MLAFIFILFMITSAQSLDTRDPLTPFLLSTVPDNELDKTTYASNNEDRLINIIDYIIKYVATIESAEDFIDYIIDHQTSFVVKIKILQFLDRCFRMTKLVVQYEIRRISAISTSNKKTLFSSLVTLEELEQAQYQIDNLLHVIKKRLDMFNSLVPPTMPFLGF